MFRLLILSLVFIGVYAFAEPKFPELTGRVVDEAGLLSKAQEQSLADMSGTIERDSTVQVVVVTLKSLDGYDIAEYGYQLARYWKVGQRDEDNGILIMIAPKDRKVRIEIGYGLEAFITDAEAYEMIQSKMLPRFKEKDVYSGIRDTIDAIGTIVSKEYQHDYGAYKPVHMNTFYIVAIALIPFLLIVFLAGTYYFSKQVTIAFKLVVSVIIGGIAGFLVWAFSHIIIISGIVALIVAIIAYYSDKNTDYGSLITDLGDSAGNIGSGDSFEIFSGGGGDFGGAGASADIGSVLDGLGSL
ncbi:MAG: TPM domain-containing protein [Sulfuricurvum sp.]|uniref:TPM domain-containing protein n=1 Tax=Sulfuricurvum sp. TaxID=2025608 RepID=UPI00263A267E|nr:TPM domain-containing protein [Sulfuricurvum sp.]MDD2828766.1 TPM domain-containing protein [Sulfuricurvum sp.]MDD4948775.1 TPM domain-containing protein [Sulfuricurvum sp.]